MLNANPVESITKADTYNNITSRINYPIRHSGTENYYYADVANPTGGKIRLIGLDILDQDSPRYNTQSHAILSQRQIDWFSGTALKEGMTSGHSVIVLIHYPLTEDPEIRKYVYNWFVYDWRVIPEIVEAFRGKTCLSKTYANSMDASDSLLVDVSYADTPGEFICYLGGHIHTYLDFEITDIGNVNPLLPKQIMIISNNMSPSDRNVKSFIERSNLGLSNNSFNIYEIDTYSKTIYVAFFGAPGLYYPSLISLKYL
jgi:hypothetical protein